jgi:hypothetical protein
MEINSNIFAHQPVKPVKPSEPTPPPGGNIENRQPPSEPTANSSKENMSDASLLGLGAQIDVYL